ncbi:rRNA maturation RNase YbeY [Paracoccaceae bacterium]|nr:rRNA maturation RNase YbeY [Paracoccaceae bacterium]
MTVRVSVNYNDPRWKRFDLTRHVRLLVSKVVQIHQIKLNYCSLSVLACGNSQIKELNRQYRKKNEATNVLAWPAIHCFFNFDQNYQSFNKNNYLFLGDIAISYERCLKEALAQNIRFNKYCCKLLAHAILHLLGYDHNVSVKTKRMQLMETRVLNSALTHRPKLYNI